MNINSNNIVSLSDVKRNTEEILESTKVKGNIFVFENNRPEYVILCIEEYNKFLDDSKEVVRDSVNNENEVLEALNAIGKKVFVEYYYVFKEDESPEEKLPQEYTLNSRRSRSSKARRLFKDEKNIDALTIIIESNRIEDEVREKAIEILKSELGNEEVIVNLSNASHNKVKVGKLARNTIRQFIEEKVINQEEILRLQDLKYSKDNFNLSYPVLKLVDKNSPIETQRNDSNGYPRYYSATVSSYGRMYLICSQWVEKLHRDKLEKWIESKK